jgi:MFS family permease
MSTRDDDTPTPASGRLGADFWKFWGGQTLSNLGSSLTQFILPLLIFRLTGSAIDLSIVTAAGFLPFPLFGLIIGAWVDRVDRKRLMIATDIGRAAVIGTIPVLATFDALPVWWLALIAFLNSTLTIAFNSAEFAAIPSLVRGDDLVAANGQIQASYSAASIIGPLLASPLLLLFSPATALTLNALTYLLSAVALVLIRRSFNADLARRAAPNLRRDIAEGLRYVFGHPVLRAISLMMLLINFIAITQNAQLVLFAKERLAASDAQVGLFYSAGSAGVVVLSLAAGFLRRRWSFSRVALGTLMLTGLLGIILAYTPWYPLAVGLWAAISGLAILFNINTGSLRQAIVPNALLGRVISVAMVMANVASPLGALVGGYAIERTGDVALVYAAIGALIFLVAFGFSFTALGHAERYLPGAKTAEAAQPAATPAVEVS